jgi:hypothetical protein
MTTPPNPPADLPPPDSWERVASTLRACKEDQKRTWGDLDSSTLGRYLAGEVADDERGVIERELADHPELRQLTDLIRDVLGDLAPVAEAPAALPFGKARKPRRVLPFLRRHAALVAAACLLVALGAVFPAGGLVSPRKGVLVASSDEVRFLDRGVASAPSPTIPFNALGTPAPAQIDAAPPAPAVPDRLEMKVHAPAASGMAAKELAADTTTRAKWMTSRDAAADHRRGREYLLLGRVAEAEKSLARSYAHCQERLGAKHPITTQAAQELANLYASALNQVPESRASRTAEPDPMQRTAFWLESDKKKRKAASLEEQIADQTLPRIQATVVPALVRALETAPTPAERQTMVSALGNLGPAAGPALPALRQSLDNATPAERTAILQTMGRIGPASVPILDQLAGADAVKGAAKNDPRNHRANLSAADRTLIRDTLHELQGPEAQAGIADEAACLSLRAIRAASVRLHHLAKAKSSGILVLIQTKAAYRPDDAACPRRLGERGVHIVLDLAGDVAVKVSPALADAGFSAAAVRDAMLGPCKAKKYDKACDAGIDLIVAQAAKLKPARP